MGLPTVVCCGYLTSNQKV